MDTPVLENMSSKMYSEKYISKHYTEFFEYLNNKYGNISIREKLYLYFNHLDEPKRCKLCGNFTKFENFNVGYRIYCSSKCSNSDPDKISSTKTNIIKKYNVENISQLQSVKDKKKDKCFKNYGVENPSQSKEIRQKVKDTCLNKFGTEYATQSQEIKDKFRNTMIEKYGVEHPSQLQHIKDKKKDTCLKNYGVEHPSQSDIIKVKKKNTNLKKYGVEYPIQSEIIKHKQKDTVNKKYMLEHPDIIQIKEDEGERVYVCKCNKFCEGCISRTFEIHGSLYHSRNYQGLEKCTILNPIDHKGKDTSIEQFVKNILDRYNIKYDTNIRLFDNLEVDIYIPDKNIAIECNGCYWHSDKIKEKKYHYNKYKVYRDNGVQLLSIWEDWIKIKPNIIESILLAKLSIYEYKIYARKCRIDHVSSNDSKIFLEQNHIQGNTNSRVRLGLYIDNVLVSLMTFSKKRRSMMGNKCVNDREWELTRFCNLKNTTVIGAASKLLKYFILNYSPESIISFASHDISNGSLYNSLGFIKENEFLGSYWYINYDMIRYHRYTFRKSELIKKGYDKDKSEFKIMDELKYYRIYDSGQSKYVLKLKKDLN